MPEKQAKKVIDTLVPEKEKIEFLEVLKDMNSKDMGLVTVKELKGHLSSLLQF
ncbi:hypothetical protein [Peribacillus butanolivorans]|uniref:hypothetical protein n=1 Tax=Peribacillus butanolivorans TaxID=421767 RepID=UPI0035E356BF